jgi:hypothetical protein
LKKAKEKFGAQMHWKFQKLLFWLYHNIYMYLSINLCITKLSKN